MNFTYTNAANVKFQSELSRYNRNRKPSRAFKPSKATFKKALRSMSAGWIRDESEMIIGLLKGDPSRDRQSMEFAQSKGWVSVQDGGKYDNFHFTTLGLQIKDEVAATTCAFSGRRCRAMQLNRPAGFHPRQIEEKNKESAKKRLRFIRNRV